MRQKKWIIVLVLDAIAWISLVAGIAANIDPANLTTANVMFVVATMGVLPFGFGLAALILGICVLVKKQKGKAAAIIGIIAALPMVCYGGFMLYGFCVALSQSGMESLKELVRNMLDSAQEAIDAR